MRGSPASSTDICTALSFPPEGGSAPPAVKPAGESVRVLVFGDFGNGSDDQMAVARAMLAHHQNHLFDFGITLGDNFYEDGLNTPAAARWDSEWEKPYGPLGIRIYASLGNHDHNDPASPLAEALYSHLGPSRTWCLPRPYYTYTAGPVQLFALDTESIVRSRLDGGNRRPLQLQKRWLDAQLDASESPWKIVYGHHPIYSTGHYQDEPAMISDILPLLKNRADVYFAGHSHDMQYLKPVDGLHFFVCGVGGHDRRPLGKDDDQRRIWARGETLGFSVLEADAGSLTVRFIDTNSSQLCKVQLTKEQTPP